MGPSDGRWRIARLSCPVARFRRLTHGEERDDRGCRGLARMGRKRKGRRPGEWSVPTARSGLARGRDGLKIGNGSSDFQPMPIERRALRRVREWAGRSLWEVGPLGRLAGASSGDGRRFLPASTSNAVCDRRDFAKISHHLRRSRDGGTFVRSATLCPLAHQGGPPRSHDAVMRYVFFRRLRWSPIASSVRNTFAQHE